MKKLAILSALIAAGATHGQNILTFAANVADGETFTIGTDVFEFTADNTPTAGRRAVDVSGGLTNSTVPTAAAAAINAGTAYSAVVVGTNVVVFHDLPGVSVACSETMAGSGNAWAAAALYGHATAGLSIPVQQSRAVSAAEVTAGIFALAFNGAVQAATVQVRTAAGALKAFDGVTRINGRVVSIDLSGSTDLAATDVVTITAKLAIVA
jgi:hypothetical protein